MQTEGKAYKCDNWGVRNVRTKQGGTETREIARKRRRMLTETLNRDLETGQREAELQGYLTGNT